MSYSIIFETKVVKLPDGRILHLSLEGCNNDDAGRKRDEFRGRVYNSESEFIINVEKFKMASRPFKDGGDFDMKIRSKCVSVYDYGEHLLRMLKRAITWQELANKYRICKAVVFKGVTVHEEGKEEVFLTSREWDKVCYDFWYGRRKGRYITQYQHLYSIEQIVEALDSNESMLFHIEN